MKRLRVDFSEEAIADIDSIYEFIFDRSRSAQIADGFINRIEARCQKIGDTPHGGRARDDWAPGMRAVPFEKTALIGYRVEADQVVITNIFYHGRDVDAVFADRD